MFVLIKDEDPKKVKKRPSRKEQKSQHGFSVQVESNQLLLVSTWQPHSRARCDVQNALL